MDAPNRAGMDAAEERHRLVREILEKIADRWTLLVIDALEGEGDMRFSHLRQRVGGISQRMLTKTLRQLERDGLVSRHVHAVVPPRVDYRLTPLGESFGEALCSIWIWAGDHLDEIKGARHAFDRGHS